MVGKVFYPVVVVTIRNSKLLKKTIRKTQMDNFYKEKALLAAAYAPRTYKRKAGTYQEMTENNKRVFRGLGGIESKLNVYVDEWWLVNEEIKRHVPPPGVGALIFNYAGIPNFTDDQSLEEAESFRNCFANLY
jgi:hypothetical protein